MPTRKAGPVAEGSAITNRPPKRASSEAKSTPEPTAAATKKKAPTAKRVPTKKVSTKKPKKATAAGKAGAVGTLKKKRPNYATMIAKALVANTPHATPVKTISEHIQANYQTPEHFRKYLLAALRYGVSVSSIFQRSKNGYRLTSKGSQEFHTKKKRASRAKPAAETTKITKKTTTGRKAATTKKTAAGTKKSTTTRKGEKTTKKRAAESQSAGSAKRAKKAAASEGEHHGDAETGDDKVAKVPGTRQPKYEYIWQFRENNGKFYNYDIDASDVCEEVYQNYLGNRGDTDVRAVKSGQWEYMVDFMAFKQTNIQHAAHTVRDCRRVKWVAA